MVVRAVNPLGIVGQDRRDRDARQPLPTSARRPHFAVLPAQPTAPRATQGEYPTVRQRRRPVVAARDGHGRAGRPRVVGGVVEAGLTAVVAAGDLHATVRQHRGAGAEHVVAGLGNRSLAHRGGGGIQDRGLSLPSTADEAAGLVSRPGQQLAVRQLRRRRRH